MSSIDRSTYLNTSDNHSPQSQERPHPAIPAHPIDPNSEEYRQIYAKIFGHELASPQINCSDPPESPGLMSPAFLTLYDQSLLKNLAERFCVGREERRFYSSIESLSAEKPLIETTLEILERVEQLFDLYPNAKQLIKLVYDYLSLRRLSQDKKAIYMPPVCIAGDAGIGKTAVIQAICRALSVDYAFCDFSSASSSWTLCGQDSGWSGSHIGLVLKTLLYGNCANPLIHIDEICKAQVNQNLDPFLALHTLLERPQMHKFVDAFAQNLPINASYVMFIATANDISAIPKTIRSRLKIIHIDPPSENQMRTISQNMYKNILQSEGVSEAFEEKLDEDVVDLLSTRTPREAGLALSRGLASAATRNPAEGRRYHIVCDDLTFSGEHQEVLKRKVGFVW